MITRAGWLVTHIYEHFTFGQSKFIKDFVVMNQKTRQTACVETLFLILELTIEITSTTIFWNLFMITSLKYLTLKSSQQFSMTTHSETFFHWHY